MWTLRGQLRPAMGHDKRKKMEFHDRVIKHLTKIVPMYLLNTSTKKLKIQYSITVFHEIIVLCGHTDHNVQNLAQLVVTATLSTVLATTASIGLPQASQNRWAPPELCRGRIKSAHDH